MKPDIPKKPAISILSPWLWRMAWRDSRSHRKRLLLFMSSIIMGIAALVAISSFGENLEKAVDDQAKTLLGADMLIRGQEPFTPDTEALFDSIGGEQSREVTFASMVYFPKNSGTRLVQVRALKGGFPYYGDLETVPPSAQQRFKNEPDGALVDHGLMVQFNLQVGDSIKIGAYIFSIFGVEINRWYIDVESNGDDHWVQYYTRLKENISNDTPVITSVDPFSLPSLRDQFRVSDYLWDFLFQDMLNQFGNLMTLG